MVKTLTIKDKVYSDLKAVKNQDESFSDLFERLVQKENKGISEFAGFLSDEKAKKMQKAISDYRKISTKLNSKRRKELEKNFVRSGEELEM